MMASSICIVLDCVLLFAINVKTGPRLLYRHAWVRGHRNKGASEQLAVIFVHSLNTPRYLGGGIGRNARLRFRDLVDATPNNRQGKQSSRATCIKQISLLQSAMRCTFVRVYVTQCRDFGPWPVADTVFLLFYTSTQSRENNTPAQKCLL